MGLGAVDANHDFDVSQKGFKHLTTTREALTTITTKLSDVAVEVEEVPLALALHRVLGEDIFSPVDVPSFDRAAMDGYAVRAEDTYSAAVNSPVMLKSVDGGAAQLDVQKGQAVSVVTGGEMPRGADAVVMIEHVKPLSDGTVEVSVEVHPTENVSRIGEDLRKGSLVLKEGEHLLPQDIGILVCLGFDHVKVKRRLKIAVVSTGSEIQDKPGGPGKVPDVNRPVLLSAVTELGCEPVDVGIAPDEPRAIREKLKRAMAAADIVLITAGTSVGPRDFVPQVINDLGKPGVLVHGVAMRPSMPTGLGIVDGKPIISLPGYPVSAYIAFIEFIPPLVDFLLGTKHMPKPTIKAKLSRRIPGVLGSRTYIRVQVTERQGTVYVEPVSVSGAGIISSLVRANGFVIVPEKVEGYEEGEVVDVELFRPVVNEKVNK